MQAPVQIVQLESTPLGWAGRWQHSVAIVGLVPMALAQGIPHVQSVQLEPRPLLLAHPLQQPVLNVELVNMPLALAI